MRRNKIYKTLEEFLSHKDKKVYEGYVIGYGYAFYEAVAIKPPHLLMNDSICPRRVPNDLSFHQMMWQQELDRSPKSIMESFGDDYKYLLEYLVNERNGMYYIDMGRSEMFEVPVKNTVISIDMNSDGEMVLKVKSSSETGSIERSVKLNMEDFHVIFGSQGNDPYLTNAAKQLGLDAYANSDTFEFGWDHGVGAAGAAVGFRGNIPHNELFWRQQNGRWRARTPKNMKNHLFKRSYQLKGAKMIGWKVGGTALGGASAGLLVHDVLSTKKIDASDVLNGLLIGVSFSGVGAIVAGLWFIVDTGTGLITGESFSDRLEKIDIIDWE